VDVEATKCFLPGRLIRIPDGPKKHELDLFFCENVENTWNTLPEIVDFDRLVSFMRTVKLVRFVDLVRYF